MVTIKTEKDIEILREGGRRLAEVVQKVAKAARPGVTTLELDKLAEKLIRDMGDEPAFLGYRTKKSETPYPTTLCTSLNDELVHCVPSDRILEEGDILSIDCGIKHEGLFTDHAITLPIGDVSKEAEELMLITKESLRIGIEAAQIGNTTGDIGYAIEAYVGGRYGIVRNLSGHGVGYQIHEDPYIPNFGRQGEGTKLQPGMVIAIEPMLNIGKEQVVFEKDFTIRTRDGSLSAHFEHTIALGSQGPEILTTL